MDNHTSNHSYLVSRYLQVQGVDVLFMPPYSSPLNVQEYAWGLFKRKWAKALARITVEYNLAGLENDISLVMDEVNASLTPAFLTANEKYLTRCMGGILA